MGIPSWLGPLGRFAGSSLDVVNAAMEYGDNVKAGISKEEAAKRAGLVGKVGVIAPLTPIGAATIAAPGFLRMAADSLAKQKIQETVGVSPLYGRGVNPEALRKTAEFADYLNPTTWASQAADRNNPELKGLVNISTNPNTRLLQIQEYLRQKNSGQ